MIIYRQSIVTTVYDHRSSPLYEHNFIYGETWHVTGVKNYLTAVTMKLNQIITYIKTKIFCITSFLKLYV